MFSESKVIKDGKYVSLTGGGRLIVGQEQDTLGGSFDETQSLSGSVTGLEVWSKVISPEDIQELASCDVETLDISERIVKWTTSQWKTFGNVTTKSQENICQPSPLLNVVCILTPQCLKIIKNVPKIVGDFQKLCDPIF